MIALENTITINRPPEDVFAFLSDLNNIPKWNPEVKTFNLVTPGPTKVGSQFVEESKMGKVNCEVTEFSQDALIAFSGVSSSLNFTERIVVEPWQNGAKLHISSTVEPKGFWKILQPLLSGEMKKALKNEMEAVKRYFDRM